MRHREYTNDLTPAIPYLFLYDKGGQQQIKYSGGTFLTWDTVKIKTSHFHYNKNDDRIIFNSNTSGFYKITFNCSYTDNQGAEVKTVNASIYKNGSELEGSKIYRDQTHSIEYVAYLQKNDYIQIYAHAQGNYAYTYAETSRLIIEFIPMQGWNNSSGGRSEYKGGVMR